MLPPRCNGDLVRFFRIKLPTFLTEHHSPYSSVLQGGYHHPLARVWQARRQLTKSMLMYPIFISDDPDAEVAVESLPGQKRWGINRLEKFLGPLVKTGLKSVILFGVPVKCQKVRILFLFSGI